MTFVADSFQRAWPTSARLLSLLIVLAACAAPPTPAPATALPPSPTPRCPTTSATCAATQLSLAVPTSGVKAFARLELGILTDGKWANPYDPAQVDLQVRFTGPDGKSFQVPAFWYQDFDPGTLVAQGGGGWRARLTPTQAGAWQAQAVLMPGNLTSSCRSTPPTRITLALPTAAPSCPSG